MKMVRLPHVKVELGAPLPWNVRDTEGRLLLSRGHVVSSEEQLQALLQRGAFVDVEEIRAAAGLVAHGFATPKHAPNLFGRWDNTISQLEILIRELPTVTDFPDRMEQFARQIVELTDLDPDESGQSGPHHESSNCGAAGTNGQTGYPDERQAKGRD